MVANMVTENTASTEAQREPKETRQYISCGMELCEQKQLDLNSETDLVLDLPLADSIFKENTV